MKDFHIIGICALPLLACSSVTDAATIVRDEQIVIEVPESVPVDFHILVNNEDATAFAQVSDNTVVLINPYPERVDEFQVSVVDAASGFEIYSEIFRTAREGEYFDSVDAGGSAQLDTSAISMGNPLPEPFDEFERNTSESNFRADYRVNAVRGNMQLVWSWKRLTEPMRKTHFALVVRPLISHASK